MDNPRVSIALDPMFGRKAEAVALGGPIWMIKSEENSLVAQELWASGRFGITEVTGVTVFEPQELSWLLPDVDLHHPDWRELEFYGVEPSPELRAILTQFGDGEIRITEHGFIFSRP